MVSQADLQEPCRRRVMAQDIYGNISTVQHEMRKINQQRSCPAEVYNFGTLPSDQEMMVSSIPGDMDEQPGRLAPRGSGQSYLYILVTICAVLLITGVCAGTVMYFQMNAEVQGVDAKVSAFKAEGTQNSDALLKLENLLRTQVENIKSNIEERTGNLKNVWQFVENISSQAEKSKEDLLQIIQNVVEKISSQEEKNKEDFLHIIQNVEEKISSQAEKNKEDLCQNIQNVGENIKSKIEEQTGNPKNVWQFDFEQISNWKRFGNKLYYFSQSSATWEKAREQCVAMGATLAMVKTQEELTFLKREGTQRSYWLGLNDLSSEGTWKWLDGSFPNNGLWAPGEPNDVGGEDCGEMHLALNDLPCDSKQAWICEKNLVI